MDMVLSVLNLFLGGWQCSDYAHACLHNNFQLELNNHLGFYPGAQREQETDVASLPDKQSDFQGKISSKIITSALKAAFKRTDRQYMAKVTGAYELGFGRDTRAGSCGIAALIIDGVIFVANAGDSRAIVVSSKQVKNPKPIMPANELEVEVIDKTEIGFDKPVSLYDTGGSDLPPNQDLVVKLRHELSQIALRKSLGFHIDENEELALRDKLFHSLKVNEQLDSPIDPDTSRKNDKTVPKTHISSFLSLFPSLVSSKSMEKRASLPDFAFTETLEISKNLFVKQLSSDHNAKFPGEQMSLRKMHPNEPDIVICKNPTSCYVKGRLQPTRAFGDFHLKYSEFKLHKRRKNINANVNCLFIIFLELWYTFYTSIHYLRA